MKPSRKRTPRFLTLLTHAGIAIGFVATASSAWT